MKTFLVFIICIASISQYESIEQSKENNRPRGLFVQVSTSTKNWILSHLDGWLQRICDKNLLLPTDQRLQDIVLSDIAIESTSKISNSTNEYTILFQVLDIIVPYLPGGSKQCFGNVFVGSLEVQWFGIGSYYINAVQDLKFRERYVNLSKNVAQEFMKRYPQIKTINWYITFESNLNYLIDSDCMFGYLSLLSETIREFTLLSRGSVMWSPTFWSLWSDLTESQRALLRSNLNTLFTTIALQSPPGVNWIVLQDGLGKSSNPNCTSVRTTISDAVNWFWFLRDSFSFTSIQMNEELFKFDNNCNLVPGNSSTQISNENFYSKMWVPVGASFEIRFWREI